MAESRLIHFSSHLLRQRSINFRPDKKLRSVHIRVNPLKLLELSTIAWGELPASTGASEK